MTSPETAADHRFAAVARSAAAAVGLFLLAATGPAMATDPAPSCAVPVDLMESPFGLPRVAERLRRGEPVKIVALGSSSTEGVGASSADATYPSRLSVELRQLWSSAGVTVVNKGVSGEQSRDMIARFERDVLGERPDLLIWQTGTNSALVHGDIEALVEDIDRGIGLAHAAGIDVLLMTPQHSPRFERLSDKQVYLENIALIASVNRVPVLRRYEMMKHWLESGQMSGPEMIDADGLHLTDRSYFCLGRTAAQLVAGLAGSTNSRIPVAGR